MKKIDYVDGKVEAIKVINPTMRVRTTLTEDQVEAMDKEESKEISGYEVLANGEYYLKTVATSSRDKKPKYEEFED